MKNFSNILYYACIAIIIHTIGEINIFLIDTKTSYFILKTMLFICVIGVLWFVILAMINFLFERIHKKLTKKDIEVSEWTYMAIAYGLALVILLSIRFFIDISTIVQWIF